MKLTYSWFPYLYFIFGTGILCDRKIEKRQTTVCSKDTFECSSGLCIDSSLTCDGRADCVDRSDETQTLCAKLFPTCPSFAFRCKYGACVDKNLRCDGKRDCIDGSDEAVSECKKNTSNSQSTCHSADQYNCINGECIDSTNICDGVKHCADGSDETASLCKNISCPKYTFKCKYGACVSKDSKCNNVIDCADGSDEECGDKTPKPVKNPPVITTTTQSSIGTNGNTCIIPNSEGSIYSYKVTNQIVSPGTEVNHGQVIEENCKKEYFKIDRYRFIKCRENGKWESDVNDTLCLRKCPPLDSSHLQFECSTNGAVVDCLKEMVNGTRATVNCRPTHHLPNGIEPTPTILICLPDGKWDGQLFKCVPSCGKVYVPYKVQTLIGNGKNASFGTAPWNVGIYDNNEMICGGTLISENVVVSAAHCFNTNLVGTDKVITNNGLYKIGIGKYKRNITIPDNQFTQIIEALNIYVHPDYFGSIGNYLNDIAIIVLETKAKMSDGIMPACMDWSKKYIISNGELGKIVGWGNTNNGRPSPDLLEANIPYINENTCRNYYKKKNTGFEIFVNADKFCAGSENVSGPSVQGGDSGAGLTFDHNNMHYLTGLVSLHDPHQQDSIAVYTNVNYHIKWIKKIYEESFSV